MTRRRPRHRQRDIAAAGVALLALLIASLVVWLSVLTW